jgi:hypothetical protein
MGVVLPMIHFLYIASNHSFHSCLSTYVRVYYYEAGQHKHFFIEQQHETSLTVHTYKCTYSMHRTNGTYVAKSQSSESSSGGTTGKIEHQSRPAFFRMSLCRRGWLAGWLVVCFLTVKSTVFLKSQFVKTVRVSFIICQNRSCFVQCLRRFLMGRLNMYLHT